MKILIGTPIHQVKDYAMERWLANVKELRSRTPTDFLMVDNSEGLDYVEKVKGYCKNLGIKDYQMEHIELPAGQGKHERVARSREVIRQYFLGHEYDGWFTWECDILLPNDSLDKLIKLMDEGDYTMVNPNKWNREDSSDPNTDFGCCLIKRQALEKNSFIITPDKNEPLLSNTDPWVTGEAWFKKRVLLGGGSYMDAYGVIGPIQHLVS